MSVEEIAGVSEPRATEEEFRAAMSRLAGGVALVAAHDPDEGVAGEAVGMTATAFVSVSLDPPLVLVSVRTGSRMDDALERQPLWAVSVLSEEQRPIAGRFAMRGRLSDRLLFADLGATAGAITGAPIVPEALAVVECRTHRRVPAGDHTLVIGAVLTATTPHPTARPLVHFRGRYHVLR
jgi:flavin reductase (DIM6/NTAB) family NADH-FMN oxidoreductase RutF